MNTGKSSKRKAGGFYVHQVGTSSVASQSSDLRRTRLRTENVGEASNSSTISASQATEDLRTLQAVDDISSFSYMLGEQLPIFPEDNDYPGANDDSIRVTLKEKRNANSDFPLAAWIPFRDEYLDEMLRLEGRGEGRLYKQCCVCRAETALPEYRCVEQECNGGGLMCKACVVSEHRLLPLHWLEFWNGRYFQTVTLRDLGLQLQLGHGPHGFCISPVAAHHDFTVLHTNGIHNVSLKFCGCTPGLEHQQQLLRRSWWPATPLEPQTASTFQLLRLFHTLNCKGKLPAYDFYKSLEAMTRGRLQKTPPDRYRVLLRTMRQWRHLKMCKRFGRGHDNRGVGATAQGELAVECPACPHPKKNLPEGWEKVDANIAFKYALFLAKDANFRVKNGMVSSDARDPTLGQGWSYFVSKPEYLEHVKQFVDTEEISSCSGFAAIFLKNLKNVKGLRTTGVVGVTCSRHGLWRANGIGDLQKGERACNVDYVFLSSVKDSSAVYIVVSYDIICQWGVHFWERMQQMKEELHLSIPEANLILLIPKFHLPAHQQSCQSYYSFNFATGVGRTHGETIEENWADSNKASAQTKEMGPGSRQDTLDDIFGFHNWMAVVSMERVMKRRMVVAVKEFSLHRGLFEDFQAALIANLGKAVIEGWDEEVVVWENDHSKPCPYESHGKDTQTLKQVQLELARTELEELARGGGVVQDSSVCAFVIMGLEIEESQRSLEIELQAIKRGTAHQELNIQKLRTALFRRVQRFHNLQQVFMPRIRHHLSPAQIDHLDHPSTAKPEKIKLLLPSDLRDAESRSAACVNGVVDAELRLREAETHDALQDLRQYLRARSATNRFKTKNTTGQVANTRAQGVQRQVDLRIHTNKLRYRYSRNALFRLKGHGPWEDSLRVLLDADVRGVNERALNREELRNQEMLRDMGRLNELAPGGVVSEGVAVVGEGHRTLSWIWYSSGRAEQDERVINEALKIEWCKARARMECWEEEVVLLGEEMRRVLEYGRWKAEWWRKKVGVRSNVSPEVSEGIDAYAEEHAARELRRVEELDMVWRGLMVSAEGVLDRTGGVEAVEVELEEEDMDLPNMVD